MSHTAIEVPDKIAGEVLNAAVSFSNRLEVGESLVLTGLAVDELVTADLTIASKIISTSILNINGIDTPVGEAVTFSISGGVDKTFYKVLISVATDSNPPQTLKGLITFNVESVSG